MITHYITLYDNEQGLSLSWPCGGEYAPLEERLEYFQDIYDGPAATWTIVEV